MSLQTVSPSPTVNPPFVIRTRLQPLERRVLNVLAELSPLSLKHLGIALGISPQHARTLMQGLEALGHVASMSPLPGHNRFTRHVYRLSTPGRGA